MVWRQRVDQSVSQLTRLYLSQWVQSCLLADWDTWSPRPQSLPSPAYTQLSCQLLLRQSSHPLGLYPNTFHDSPFPLEKNPRSLGGYSEVHSL